MGHAEQVVLPPAWKELYAQGVQVVLPFWMPKPARHTEGGGQAEQEARGSERRVARLGAGALLEEQAQQRMDTQQSPAATPLTLAVAGRRGASSLGACASSACNALAAGGTASTVVADGALQHGQASQGGVVQAGEVRVEGVRAVGRAVDDTKALLDKALADEALLGGDISGGAARRALLARLLGALVGVEAGRAAAGSLAGVAKAVVVDAHVAVVDTGGAVGDHVTRAGLAGRRGEAVHLAGSSVGVDWALLADKLVLALSNHAEASLHDCRAGGWAGEQVRMS